MNYYADSSNNYRLLQVLNLLGFIVMVVVNYLSNALPINGLTAEEVSDKFYNLFVPAGFTFAIWGVIYLLLGIFVIYQALSIFTGNRRELSYVRKLSYLFFTSCILNSIWLFAWHYLRIGLALIIMVLLLLNLILIYRRLRNHEVKNERLGTLVRGAFSIYIGWITIATIANVSAWLVSIEWGGFGVSEVFWMIVVLIVATAIVLRFMFKYWDWLYGLVAVWAFFGIISARLQDDPVQTLVVVMTAICLAVVAAGIGRLILWKKKSIFSSS